MVGASCRRTGLTLHPSDDGGGLPLVMGWRWKKGEVNMELVFMSIFLAVVGVVGVGDVVVAPVGTIPTGYHTPSPETDKRLEEGQRSTRCHRGGRAWP